MAIERHVKYKFTDLPREHLPEPRGEAVLVQMPEVDTTLGSGLILSSAAAETQKFLTHFARVEWIGPEAYQNHRASFPCASGPWCKEGEYVLLAHHAGQGIDVLNPETGTYVRYKLMPASNILAGLKHPQDVITYTN